MLKSKDQAFEKFKELKSLLKNQYNVKIKSLKSDGGGEYISNEFKSYLKENGIIQRLSPPYTPQMNGVAERYNRKMLNKIRCMLKGKNLDNSFWGEAINTANQLRNVSPTMLKEKSPEEEFTGRKPDLTKIRTFGSRVMMKDKRRLQKLEDKTKAIYVAMIVS